MYQTIYSTEYADGSTVVTARSLANGGGGAFVTWRYFPDRTSGKRRFSRNVSRALDKHWALADGLGGCRRVLVDLIGRID